MPLAYGPFPGGVPGNGGDGKIHLGEPFTFFRDHLRNGMKHFQGRNIYYR
jgi:hypothetical protein